MNPFLIQYFYVKLGAVFCLLLGRKVKTEVVILLCII